MQQALNIVPCHRNSLVKSLQTGNNHGKIFFSKKTVSLSPWSLIFLAPAMRRKLSPFNFNESSSDDDPILFPLKLRSFFFFFKKPNCFNIAFNLCHFSRKYHRKVLSFGLRKFKYSANIPCSPLVCRLLSLAI